MRDPTTWEGANERVLAENVRLWAVVRALVGEDLAAIASEFVRQGRDLGYTAEHDQNEVHQHGELAQAACYMAWPEGEPIWETHATLSVDALFPTNWDIEQHSFREGKTPRDRLVAAGALILAEMRRLRMQGGGDAQ